VPPAMIERFMEGLEGMNMCGRGATLRELSSLALTHWI
jgi:hypothetical protein